MAAPPPRRNDVENGYSNLEVVQTSDLPEATYHDNGLQVVDNSHSPYTDQKGQPVPVASYYGTETKPSWVEADPNSLPTARQEAGFAPEPVPPYYNPDSSLPQTPAPTICGIRRRTFWIIAGIVGLVVIAAAVGGGVGGALSNRSSAESANQTSPGNSTNPGSGSSSNNTTPVAIQDAGIAALGWVDTNGVSHYRVYHQPVNQSSLWESKWSSDSQIWLPTNITSSSTEPAKRGSPLVAISGYPHANSSFFDMQLNVYYQQPGGVLMERSSTDISDDWSHQGFSTKKSASPNSTVFAHWYQDLINVSHVLTVFYQEAGAGSLSMARYVESKKSGTTSDWASTKQNIDIADGSPIAAAPAGRAHDLRMYIIKSDGTLTQYPYDVDRNTLGEPDDTNVKLAPKTPVCVIPEDNRNRVTGSTVPQCASGTAGAFFTHLILYATPDRTSLNLLAWDCANGFVDQTSRIEPLLKPGRTYLALTTATPVSGTPVTEGQRVYVLFDDGRGPLMEEWEVPASGTGANTAAQGGPWKLLGGVSIYVSSTPSSS